MSTFAFDRSKRVGVGAREPRGHVRIDSWSSALEYLDKGRYREDTESRPIARNTRLVRDEHCIREECGDLRAMGYERACAKVVLHFTAIVSYHFDGAVELDTGGWYTPTTKDRINRFAPRWVSLETARRYIPMAERVQTVVTNHQQHVSFGLDRIEGRLNELYPDHEDDWDGDQVDQAIKSLARQEPKHESFWVVRYNPSFDYDTYERHCDEVIRYHDHLVLRAPDLREPRGPQGVDLEQPVKHRLASGVRAGSW